jgi:hypothetical protein
MNMLDLSSSVRIAHITSYWQMFLLHYTQVLCHYRLCKADHAYWQLSRKLYHRYLYFLSTDSEILVLVAPARTARLFHYCVFFRCRGKTCPHSCSLATAVVLSPVYTAVTWRWVYMSQYWFTLGLKVNVCWDVNACSLVGKYQRCREACRLHL